MGQLDWGDEQEKGESSEKEEVSYFPKEDPLRSMAGSLRRISHHQWWIALSAKIALIWMFFILLYILFGSMQN